MEKALDTSGYLLPDGTLRAFSSVGSYPIFYVSAAQNVCCAKCAQVNDPETRETFAVAADAHWEGEPLSCEACDAEIESAYGVPE